ncbi:hypothetical protein H257_09923 [Aphanomyces astaci]|uniref:Crinkler effector protein N-terminal domain-containing protein n=1 Tax=Aphanomyces astaci TaxID=112090 RepID=W4G8F9_APHAT|nr:hypothetical protein H257_09923 [Aphanomyces astaci]ETV75965.1 hypothetical protein H257_09923 [Aphanomyces astaci]|eukprot:XP_009834607.1 hypothetical protein H257_09923 [Aphanomyces astaci]
MPRVWCMVVGNGIPFPVDIGADETAGDLKQQIKKGNPSLIACDAKDLTLFRAFKNGAWLTSDAAKDVTVDDLGDFTMMNPQHLIQDPANFPANIDVNAVDILVLAAVPVVAPPSVASLTSDVPTPLTKYTHSGMNTNNGQDLLTRLNVVVKCSVASAVGDQVVAAEPFKWEDSSSDGNGQSIPLTEEQQSQRYRAYLEAHLVAVLKKHKLCVFAVDKGDDILSAAIPGHDILLVCGTDLVILDDLREVDINSTYEATSQLIALDALAPDYVMVLLTDLTTTWEFLWISDIHPPCIHKMYVATPGDAFQVIRAIVDDDETELELACMERPLKRRKLDEACEDAGDGIRERVQQYYDIQSMLGPDDDMAEALARGIVRCIPQYRAHIEFK